MRIFLAALVLGGMAVSVLAQSSPEEARVDAREAYRRGLEAAEDERWADSERWFGRAYALSDEPSALFNRAVALRALGRYVEARDAFEALLARELTEPVRARAHELLAQTRARIARLQLEGLPEATHTVELDGAPRPDSGERPVVLEVDEGEHALVVGREGFEPYRWRGRVAGEETETLHVVLTPREVEVVTVEALPRSEPPPPRRSVLEAPWFWVLVGVAVLGGVAVGVGVGFSEAQVDPASGVVFSL